MRKRIDVEPGELPHPVYLRALAVVIDESHLGIACRRPVGAERAKVDLGQVVPRAGLDQDFGHLVSDPVTEALIETGNQFHQGCPPGGAFPRLSGPGGRIRRRDFMSEGPVLEVQVGVAFAVTRIGAVGVASDQVADLQLVGWRKK